MPTNREMKMTNQMMERLVTPEDLAELLSVTTGQLAQMRYLGTGPKYVKVGTRVRYSLSDVRAWLDEQRRART
jgi:predicted DNA-binding transcriptional regulator AlpA